MEIIVSAFFFHVKDKHIHIIFKERFLKMADYRLEKLSADTVRVLSAEGVQKAKSGHPGMPMGCADYAFLLWYKYMKHNPKNPKWLARDRFVLSAGHGSMLLYSLLHLSLIHI